MSPNSTCRVYIQSRQKLSKFKTKTSKKGASGIAEYTGSHVDGSTDASYLLMPSIVSHFNQDPYQGSTKYISKAFPFGLSTNSTFFARCLVRGVQQDRKTSRPFPISLGTTYDGPSRFIITTSRCIILVLFRS